MSLNTIMSAATSGLNAAQTGLRVVSDNIANINTTGYVRKQVMQTSLVSQGMGVGVDIASVRRAADTYLQGASLLASSDAGRHGAVAEGLVAFLAGIGVLGGVAMWIGARAKRAA